MTQEQGKLKNLIMISIYLIGPIIIGIIILKRYLQPKPSNITTIGIVQTISHPALDRARIGFINYIKEKLGENNVAFITQNGEGSIPQMHTITKNMKGKVDAYYAIATPAAQIVAHIEKTKPIAISAVSDPKAAGLIHPTTNVCGSTDAINIQEQITLIRQLVPNAKRVAILYNPGEINSVVTVKKMEIELKKQQMEIIKIGINNESEIVSALSLATRKADVLLTPADNLIVSAMVMVASLALKAKKPLIVSDNPSTERGALASPGVDYYDCGKLAGEALYEVIIKKKKPYQVPIKHPETKIMINQTTLQKLGLTIPQEIKNKVKLVK